MQTKLTNPITKTHTKGVLNCMKIKLIDPNITLKHIGGKNKSNWIDVQATKIKKVRSHGISEELEWISERNPYIPILKGTFFLVYLGFAAELPKNTEAHVAPRGSTFKKYHIIQTNSVGVVDSSYCGDNDEWFVPFLAMENTIIEKYDRIAQFRTIEIMPNLNIEFVKTLNNKDRNGLGSTGY